MTTKEQQMWVTSGTRNGKKCVHAKRRKRSGGAPQYHKLCMTSVTLGTRNRKNMREPHKAGRSGGGEEEGAPQHEKCVCDVPRLKIISGILVRQTEGDETRLPGKHCTRCCTQQVINHTRGTGRQSAHSKVRIVCLNTSKYVSNTCNS